MKSPWAAIHFTIHSNTCSNPQPTWFLLWCQWLLWILRQQFQPSKPGSLSCFLMYEDWHQPQGERSREYGRGRVSCTPLTPRESFVAEAVGALIWTWHSPIPQRLLFWPLCCQAVKQTVVHVPDGVDCMPGQRGHSGKMPCLHLPFNISRSLEFYKGRVSRKHLLLVAWSQGWMGELLLPAWSRGWIAVPKSQSQWWRPMYTPQFPLIDLEI